MRGGAKIYATIFDYRSTPDMPPGAMRFTVEWKQLTGARAGGKTTVLVEDISSGDRLSSDLREALSADLSARFSPEVFRPRDIVGI